MPIKQLIETDKKFLEHLLEQELLVTVCWRRRVVDGA